MKTVAVYALALLLVSPTLARPNLVEPIYLRRRSNPLEIVEESVESSTVHPVAVAQGSAEQQTSTYGSTESSGSSTSSNVSGGSSSSTHQPRYQTTNDGLSSDSLIKEFLLKNLANLQGQSLPPQPPPPPPPENAGSEEQNTLRSVSPWSTGLGYPLSGNWDPPEKSGYVYPVKTQYAGPTSGPHASVDIGHKRKPVIQKIMTKWSDKTSDVFNVEYSTPPVSFLRPSSQIYSNFGVTPGAPSVPLSIVTHSGSAQGQDQGQHVQYGGFGSPEVFETNFQVTPADVYQLGPGPITVHDQVTPGNTKKKHKKKNKIKITIQPTATLGPVKIAAQPQADPDRPDALYSSELDPYGQQSHGGGSWDPYSEDPYEEASPYDEAGNLKGEGVTDAVSNCNDIRISVNGKQGCNEIQIAIGEGTENPSPTKQGDLTKTGPGSAAPLASALLPAIGAAGALAAAPQSAAPLAVANDVAFAAPLAAAAPLSANPIAPVVPALFPPVPVSSFLNTPISNIVSNIIRPPVRVGGLGNPAATVGNGVASNGNKNKVKPAKPSHDHGSSGLGSLVPDMSHALVGMLAAVSAMTPMNMFVLGMTSLPVLAMLVGTLAAGMYMYKFYYPTPVRHYTTTVLVQKKPPVSYHWTRRPAKPSRRPTRYSWVDVDHSPAVPIGWGYDRRSMRHGKTRTASNSEPYRYHKPSSPSSNGGHAR